MQYMYIKIVVQFIGYYDLYDFYLQLANTEEYIDSVWQGNLGEVLIR